MVDMTEGFENFRHCVEAEDLKQEACYDQHIGGQLAKRFGRASSFDLHSKSQKASFAGMGKSGTGHVLRSKSQRDVNHTEGPTVPQAGAGEHDDDEPMRSYDERPEGISHGQHVLRSFFPRPCRRRCGTHSARLRWLASRYLRRLQTQNSSNAEALPELGEDSDIGTMQTWVAGAVQPAPAP